MNLSGVVISQFRNNKMTFRVPGL